MGHHGALSAGPWVGLLEMENEMGERWLDSYCLIVGEMWE